MGCGLIFVQKQSAQEIPPKKNATNERKKEIKFRRKYDRMDSTWRPDDSSVFCPLFAFCFCCTLLLRRTQCWATVNEKVTSFCAIPLVFHVVVLCHISLYTKCGKELLSRSRTPSKLVTFPLRLVTSAVSSSQKPPPPNVVRFSLSGHRFCEDGAQRCLPWWINKLLCHSTEARERNLILPDFFAQSMNPRIESFVWINLSEFRKHCSRKF